MSGSKNMDRKDFLRLLGMGGPALLLMPGLLSSCKKFPLPDKRFEGNVGIVGAGIAGLFAADLLKRQGVEVTVYEASNRIGGRIRSVGSWADHGMEWGAQEILGKNHVLYDLLLNNAAQFVTSPLQDYAWVNGYWLSEELMNDNPATQKLDEIIASLNAYDGADMIADLYAENQGILNSTKHIWNARMGVQKGCSTDLMGIRGIAEGIQNSSNGNESLLFQNGNWEALLLASFQDVVVNFNTAISSVLYNSSKVTLSDTNGTNYQHDKVLIAVPHSILKSDLVFQPTLPAELRAQINSISMRPALMVALRFNESFWPADSRRIQIPGLCHQFDVTGSGGRSSSNSYLMARITGTQYDEAIALGSNLVPTLLADLDDYFGNQVASTAYLESQQLDWGSETWIQGAQSYAPVGTQGSRSGLTKSVEHKLYFAGEATHAEGHHGTVHGAMETAIRAVQQILQEI
jgi:monoamine oxidase